MPSIGKSVTLRAGVRYRERPMNKNSPVAARPAKTASSALAVQEARAQVKAAKQRVKVVKEQLKLARAAVKTAKSARKRAEVLAGVRKRAAPAAVAKRPEPAISKPAPRRKVARAKVPVKRVATRAPRVVAKPATAKTDEPKLLPIQPAPSPETE